AMCSSLFFFFQAEDGIRDFHVTGVQTCARPISLVPPPAPWAPCAPPHILGRGVYKAQEEEPAWAVREVSSSGLPACPAPGSRPLPRDWRLSCRAGAIR